MECREIKDFILMLIEGEPQDPRLNEVKAHLEVCPSCRKEAEALQKTWLLLGEWKDIAPSSGYVSEFWTKIAQKKPWPERIAEGLKKTLIQKRPAPVFIGAGILMIVISLFALRNYFQGQEAEQMVAALNEEEMEVFENMDIAENYELIENMDLLMELEIIENLEALQT